MNRYIIDRGLLRSNIERVVAEAGVPVIGVVKADGYGLGMALLADELSRAGINRFAVTEPGDVAALRAIMGPDAEILLMRSTALDAEIDEALAAGATLTVGSPAAGAAASAAAKRMGGVARCHLKVDTGFSRFGFFPSQIEEMRAICVLPGLEVCGLYTHFSAAWGDAALTRRQCGELEAVARKLAEAGFPVACVHASNSPALYNVPEARLDAVRIGSAFLGRVITPAATGLGRVGYLEAQVIETKRFPKGAAIGYGGVEVLGRDTLVAFVSAGRREGFGLAVERPSSLRRVLSGLKHLGGHPLSVEINGAACPVLGEVDLSLCMVDATEVPVAVGDIARLDPNPLVVPASVERCVR